MGTAPVQFPERRGGADAENNCLGINGSLKTRTHYLCETELMIQVRELHGRPDDVYFVDLRTLHASAPNASSKPRIMVTLRYLMESVYDEAMDDADEEGLPS
jgi:hypothetical protein